MKTIKRIAIFSLILSILLGCIPFNGNVYAKTNEKQRPCGMPQPEITYVDDSGFTEDMYFHEETDSKYAIQKAVKCYDWDKFSNKYYYNKLNKEEKKLWDNMDKQCKKYLTGTASLKVNGLRCEMPFIKSNLSQENMYKVWNMFIVSNPQYYFVGYGASLGINSVALTVFVEYANGNKRAKTTEAMRVKLEQWLDDITENSDAGIDRIRTAACLVCEKVMYDYAALDDMDKLIYDQSVITAVLDELTVCAGYARLFSMLSSALGYNTIVVVSDTHAWNCIEIDGKWYLVDTTWADLGGCIDGEALFVSDKNMTVNNPDHTPIIDFKKVVPSCKKDYPMNHGFSISEIFIEQSNEAIKITNSYDVAPPYMGKGYYTVDGTVPNEKSAMVDLEKGIPTKDLIPGTTIRIVYTLHGVPSRIWSYKYMSMEAPVITTIKNTENGIKIEWSASKKAKGFRVYRKTENTEYEQIREITSAKTTSCIDKKINEGITYTYAVVAYDSKGKESKYSHGETMCRMACKISKAKKLSATSAKISWKKNTEANGYQVSYSASSKFSYAKTLTVKGKTSTTVKGLKKGTKYYVRVRSYKLVGGVKYYSAWSKVLNCKL